MKKLALILLLAPHYLAASAIIFDFGNVLAYISHTRYFGHLGTYNVASYCLDGNPFTLKHAFFEYLDTIQPHDDPYHGWQSNTQKLPAIMCDWMKGSLSSQEIKAKIADHLDAHCTDESFKSIAVTLSEAMFTPEILADCLVLHNESIELVKLCRMLGHKTYLLSNLDIETYHAIQKKYPWFAQLFDGIVISGETGYIKPDPYIYHIMLNRFAIDPQNAVFIDDIEHNLTPARDLGIFTILGKQEQSGLDTQPYTKYIKNTLLIWLNGQFCKNYYAIKQTLLTLQHY